MNLGKGKLYFNDEYVGEVTEFTFHEVMAKGLMKACGYPEEKEPMIKILENDNAQTLSELKAGDTFVFSDATDVFVRGEARSDGVQVYVLRQKNNAISLPSDTEVFRVELVEATFKKVPS